MIVDSRHPVFCHGSTDLDLRAAEMVMSDLRRALRSQAAEVKADQLLNSRAAPIRAALFGSGGPLDGHAQMYLVDKQYFVVAKVIDLLVEELAHANGVDLYGSGRARAMAHTLYTKGPRAFTTLEWDGLLRQFNSVMRSTHRRGVKTSVDEFFETIENLRYRSRRRQVDEIIEVLARTRPFADEFQAQIASRENLRTMDPLLAALPETIRIWFARRREPLSVLHDNQAVLDKETVDKAVYFLRNPLPEFRRFHGPVHLEELVQIDSKLDPRVQVADLIAGIGRLVGTAALDDTALPIDPRNLIARSSLWADDRSWLTLTGLPSVVS